MILVVAIAATARAETGYDAWLRYAPLPAPIMARMGSVPTSVTLIGDSPLLRSARDEIVRGLSSMLATQITTSTAPPRTSTILLGTLERIRPLVPGAPMPTDLTDDGWPDIYVVNDSVPNLLFRNKKDGTFVEEGLISGASLSGDGRPQAGMGVDAADYNGDGLPDLIVTNFSHDYNTLYENGPAGVFTDRSYATGIAVTAGPYLGWGVKLADFDNDGRLDIFIVNGHVYPEVDKHGLGTRYQQQKQLFLNEGKRFRHATKEVGGGLVIEKSSRGAAFGDYDNDGDIDALVVNMNDTPTLLRNDTLRTRHWLTLRLIGTKSNRDAIGAKVIVEAGGRRQTAIVRGDGSYMSHSDVRAHFGLGEVTKVSRVEIRWPSGLVQNVEALAVDQFYVVKEGAAARAGH